MIYRSPYSDVAIPDSTYHEFLMQRAAQWGDKPALIDGPSGRTLTYRGLIEGVAKVAGGLAGRGFGKGDVFAILLPNLPEYALVFFAVAAVGGINTTINPLYTVDELTNQLNDSRARFLVTVPPFLDKAREAAARSPLEEVFVLGEAEGATPFGTLMETGAPPPAVEIDPREDLIVLPYSSGTTGLPKGVMLTHRNLVANIVQVEGVYSKAREDTVIAVLPFYHIYGMVVIMGYALAGGNTIVTMPRFEMEEYLATLEKYGVTLAYSVPPIVLGMAKHPSVDKYDLSRLERMFCGAAPLGENVASEARSRLGCTMLQGYGLTETSPVTHLSPDDPARINLASIGNLAPDTEAKIVDIASGVELGPGRQGELWVRGPQVMKGYLNQPEATAAALDEEGWFKTGDIARVDEEEYFYIVDRLKELIKYKGHQVAPAELEALLLSHPAVLDAAVIPSPDEEAGEVPKAFVVPNGQAEAEELMAYVAGRVAPFKRIRRLEFIDQIPKSPSGKILRRFLVERERAGPES